MARQGAKNGTTVTVSGPVKDALDRIKEEGSHSSIDSVIRAMLIRAGEL